MHTCERLCVSPLLLSLYCSQDNLSCVLVCGRENVSCCLSRLQEMVTVRQKSEEWRRERSGSIEGEDPEAWRCRCQVSGVTAIYLFFIVFVWITRSIASQDSLWHRFLDTFTWTARKIMNNGIFSFLNFIVLFGLFLLSSWLILCFLPYLSVFFVFFSFFFSATDSLGCKNKFLNQRQLEIQVEENWKAGKFTQRVVQEVGLSSFFCCLFVR